MQKFTIKILFICLIFLSSSSIWSQWEQVKNNLPDWSSAIALDAVNNNSAVICVAGTTSGSKIFITKNRGETWDAIDFSDKVFPVDVSMIDDNNLWIATADGEIYFTENGGSDWVLQFSNNLQTKVINYIEMFDSLNGVAVGDGITNSPIDSIAPAIVFKTNDGGKNWRSQIDTLFGGYSGDTWRRIDFVDTTHGYFFVSGIEPQKLFKTTNSGINWGTTGFNNYTTVIKFCNRSFGLAANQAGKIFRTVNGGDSWTETEIDAGWGNDFEFIPNIPARVWFASKRLFFSSDSGKSWNDYTFTDGNIYIRDIKFTDELNGWLLTDSLVYTTNNNGAVTSVETDKNIPTAFKLKQNYPNPFNPTTHIEYSIPKIEGEYVRPVQLKIFDIIGREVTTLVNKSQTAGNYSVEFNASDLSSGIYFYRLTVGRNIATKKMILLK